ncbi:MAG TPA: S-methyl-5-thioribose-1-phosphate isomerase [Pseudonocardiaceae bacterium]
MGPRTLDWVDNAIVTPDQRLFPGELSMLRLTTVDDLVAAISSLAVRGAPALGIAGALGVALSAQHHPHDPEQVKTDADRIANARPTAVNLAWGVARALARLADGPEAVLAEAMAVLDADERVNRAAATRAADLLRRLGPDRPLRVLTHCNAGRLATGAWGTALGAIRDLAARDAIELVIATETRPLLQGARLTAWELAEAGIPYRVCVDSAAPALIARGLVDCVVVGADRVAVNGDTANKIGTYSLALAAARAGIPFVVVAPEATIDPDLPDGTGIHIEERATDEVTNFAGRPTAPVGTQALNPAFDVTPADLITAVVTEQRTLLDPDRRHGSPLDPDRHSPLLDRDRHSPAR